MNPRICLIAFISLILVSCGLIPRKVDYNNPELEKYWTAIKKVERKAMGFSEIEKDSKIALEEESFMEKPYDKMLHVYGSTSRTIAFGQLKNGDLKWIGEQEIYKGPNTYSTPDGEFNEQIVLTYELHPISGHEINKLNISYYGENSELVKQGNLTLEIVKPYMEKWIEKK